MLSGAPGRSEDSRELTSQSKVSESQLMARSSIWLWDYGQLALDLAVAMVSLYTSIIRDSVDRSLWSTCRSRNYVSVLLQ